MSVIQQAISYLENQVYEPALIHPTLPDEIKGRVKKSRSQIRSFSKVGDLYSYLSRFTLDGGLDANIKTHDVLKEYGLETLEDILPKFVEQFSNHIKDVTTIDDFVIGALYTTTDIMNFAQNYNQFRGIFPIGDEGSYYTIFIKATISGEKYSNEWLKEGEELKYYFYSHKGNFSPDYELNKAIIDFPKLPIYVFIKSDSEESIFRLEGVFELKQAVYPPDGKNWFHLIKRNEKAPEALFLASKVRADFEEKVAEADKLSQEELSKKVSVPSQAPPRKISTISEQFVRDSNVVRFVLRRAKGCCEKCKKPAPFISRKGEPYLEVHHRTPLAKGGLDNIDNAMAVCPNCHRELHFG